MNRYEATMAQTRAVGRLNIQIEAEKLVKRIYQTRRPAGSANEDVAKWITDRRYGYRVEGGPLIRLTEIGKRYAREIGS
ncbi:hypothetical protein [Neorhizobium lilium]|uniref:hypothetical protein n=1 Tax=Neorhizobium lilium TaxID=2503024 RepID=UPI0013E3C99A|nr:hypothetical protein [Neorhizobium lilium]